MPPVFLKQCSSVGARLGCWLHNGKWCIICWKAAGEHAVCTHPLWHLCWGQDHENVPRLVAFWSKAWGDRLQLTQQVSNSLFSEWVHLVSLSQTIAGFVLKSRMISTHTDTVCGRFHSKLQYDFMHHQNKQLGYYFTSILNLLNSSVFEGKN